MFHSATVKLTSIYVAILLVICAIFTLLLYQVLSNELANNYSQQTDFFAGQPRFQKLARDPEALRFLDDQLSEGKQHILLELIYIDIALLITGGVASYFLARKTLQPIEAAHEAQTRFTADASHELRTPLATMQTEIEVALRDPRLKLAESKQLLGSNLEEISTLRQLTTGLLTLARGTPNSTTPQRTNLHTAVTNSLARTQKNAEAKQLVITTRIPKQLFVIIEDSQLTELLVILIDNAIKYSKPKQAIAIQATVNDGKAQITVQDEGIGISETDQAHVFERFYRADNARSQSGKNGHGLGLAIAKQLVEQYGGSIYLSSQLGKGTAVTVSLLTA